MYAAGSGNILMMLAAEADVPYKMLLESMLRKLEYQAALALPGEDVADVSALRRALGMGPAG